MTEKQYRIRQLQKNIDLLIDRLYTLQANLNGDNMQLVNDSGEIQSLGITIDVQTAQIKMLDRFEKESNNG